MDYQSRFASIAKREKSVLTVILGAFFLVTLTTLTRMPAVYCDEPPYTDAAANLYFGQGFTSTMWGQPPDAFWCGNVPLYQVFLYLFFKAFGFGLLQTRLVNILLNMAGAALIWAAVRQASLIRSAAWRLLVVVLVLSGSITVGAFRTIRPDTTMFFVCALVFYFSCWRNTHRRYWLTALASIFLPIAGVPMVPYAGMLILIHFICFGLADFGLLMAVGGGFVMGVTFLAVLYHHFASVNAFAQIVLPYTAAGHANGGPYWMSKITGNYPDDPHADSLFTCFFGRPFEMLRVKVLFDWSAFLLFAVFISAAIACWRKVKPELCRRWLFVILVTLLVPPVMHLAGHYRSPYRWMTYVPLAIAVPWLLDTGQAIIGNRIFNAFAVCAIGLAIAMGVPARTVAALPDWAGRNTVPMEHVTAGRVRSNDVVVCDYQVWYAVRPRAHMVYVCNLPSRGQFNLTAGLPTNNITLLCLLPEDYGLVTNTIGGDWQKVSIDDQPDLAAYKKSRYAVDFYRRKPN